MAKKKLTMKNIDELEQQPAADKTPEMTPGRAGGLLGHAMESSTKIALREIREDVAGAILRGGVSLEIPTDQIDENPEVGSDRVGDWKDDPDLEILVHNIRERGQLQPIRVRPADTGWRPNKIDAFKIDPDDRFIIQSGRRRLEACKRLGIPVLAHLVVDLEDLDLADLEERYFENTMRKDLSGFERLLSIGSLAKKLNGMSQQEVAKRLGVSQPYVSGGLKVVENENLIEERIDTSTASIREILALLPDLKFPEGQGASNGNDSVSDPSDKVKPAQAKQISLRSGGSYRIKRIKSGISVAVKGIEITDEEAFEDALSELLERHRRTQE
ncbi:ParB/RepB/Spo0J family partition protein [Roseovarius sp. D0-M9]|uniref:ParB/RepB/Spo0J family partition protein n=1 Tax=Roseovarius sp. D0-M9 TaxID=3127117 RepID=UPI003010610A